MLQSLNWLLTATLCACLGITGCTSQQPFVAAPLSDVEQKALNSSKIGESDIQLASYDPRVNESALQSSLPPFTLNSDPGSVSYWDLSLEEAIQFALANSTVMRDIGAHLLQASELAPTIYDPSLRATDGRFGEEAALSAFDAQWGTRLFYERNDRALNNSVLGGGTNLFKQDLWRFQTELAKRAATGTRVAVRHNIEDDLNNAPRNIFGTAGIFGERAWTWNLEAEVRHPLLQGGGADFNRIAGPDAVPGEINGVLIARVDTSISAADFQVALRNYLSNVENAYWELVFAYRDLDVKKAARDRSLATWRRLKELNNAGLAGAEDDKVAQAEEQYYRFQQDVETALNGRIVDGTSTYNGSTGGTFQGVGGVYVAERRLRLIMGAPITDGSLIRPSSEPSPAEVAFDWQQLMASALANRTELLQQRLRIKRRRLELTSSRNFLLPQFDVVGRYRRRGFGSNLYDPRARISTTSPSINTGTDEWQVGLEWNVPIGYRRAHAAVRNAELAIARETAIYEQLERQIIHDIGNAVSEQARLQRVLQTAYNRRSAALRQFTVLNSEAVQESRRGRRIDFNLLLDSERRLADAELAYYRATVEYAVALKNVNLESENLLNYCNVQIAGP